MNGRETAGRGDRYFGDAVYRKPISGFTRLFLLFGAAIAFLALYGLVIRSDAAVFQLGMIPFWIISVVASVVCIVFLLAAVFSSQTVRFDPASRRMYVRAESFCRVSYSFPYSFEELGPPHVRVDSRNGRAPVYCLEIPVKGRYRFIYGVAVFQTEALANAEATRLQVLLGA